MSDLIMKSFTDKEQSKKLVEILPIESADMFYTLIDQGLYLEVKQGIEPSKDDIPCWSLAALLDIIPKRIKDYNILRIDIGEKDFAIWYDEIGYGVNNDLPDITMESAVDACVTMIEKLHEQNIL